MKKKERNRKAIFQNKRNKMRNRRYLSTINTLFKFFLKKRLSEKVSINEKTHLMNSLYSVIDKAVKKGVIHKNNAARKKSKVYIVSLQF